MISPLKLMKSHENRCFFTGHGEGAFLGHPAKA
jgi:hypothetical protein